MPRLSYRALAISGAAMIGVPVIAIFAGKRMGDGATVGRAKEDLRELSKSIDEYKSATGVFPTAEEGFDILIHRPNPSPAEWRKTLTAVPHDPWRNLYRYRLSVRNGSEVPEVLSRGKDGVLGTDDDLSSLDR